MRTPQQIHDRYRSLRAEHVPGTAVLTPFLDEPDGAGLPAKRRFVLEVLRLCLEEAFAASLAHHGVRTDVAVHRVRHVCWLLDDDVSCPALAIGEPASPYAAPWLAEVARFHGFPAPRDERTTRMIAGRRCSSDCDECFG